MNRVALRKISYGIYIITSGQNGKFNGQIANSIFQVTSNPATLAVSINKENYTHELIEKSRKFVVSVLSEAAPMTFMGPFGFKCGRNINKLQNVKTKIGTTKIPIILDNAVSYIEVEVEKEMDCGTHTIFFGNVVDGDVISDADPMTYAYYQKVKGGKSPKTAPTYVQEEPAAVTPSPVATTAQNTASVPAARYVCTVCGYVYDPANGDPDNGITAGTKFEDLPDSWKCPICGADKSKFEKE